MRTIIADDHDKPESIWSLRMTRSLRLDQLGSLKKRDSGSALRSTWTLLSLVRARFRHRRPSPMSGVKSEIFFWMAGLKPNATNGSETKMV
ncbi:hypothetical protein PoB_001921600 [Plakobranchus ocellatus]|uniref:Uncharacterized protein n=1 Tax=Plakobranchus ocellatus TaxID=259542 RepID=A0AAV3ZDJ3_9GAST|nr:hypothetical protein PoB_001921600 [Plakobranchus ocellatus]